MLNKRMQKLIATGTALLMSLTVLFVGIWAILSTEKVGLTVNVSFDSAVTAKVYLATDSSTADTFKQPNATVTAENFAKANSALIVDTYSGAASQKATFEALGTGNGLKCDANGEMEFYVYVENYSTTEYIYYLANISFVGTGDQTAPFSTVTNPSYEFAEAGEVGNPSTSLLTFKIKSTYDTGLNANSMKIALELQGLPTTAMGFYDETNTSGMTVNYRGLYWIEFGEYQETPIRWLIIGSGNSKWSNQNSDVLNANQLLLLSENVIQVAQYHTSKSSNITWSSSALYLTSLPNLQNLIFTESELEYLSDIDGVGHKLSLLSYDMTYLYTNYDEPTSLLKTTAISERYWIRNACSQHGSIQDSTGYGRLYVLVNSTGSYGYSWQNSSQGIRPIIVLNI